MTKDNIKSSFENKKVLIIERDLSLDYGMDTFQEILDELGIENKILLDISNLPFTQILEEINQCDVLVYQTQWVYEISGQIKNYMIQLQDKKQVVEVVINEPSWWYQKEDVVHEMYFFKESGWDGDDHEFYKLSDKPYWDYKNNFDK